MLYSSVILDSRTKIVLARYVRASEEEAGIKYI